MEAEMVAVDPDVAILVDRVQLDGKNATAVRLSGDEMLAIPAPRRRAGNAAIARRGLRVERPAILQS
jgi:hypothetical protein